MGKEAYVTSLVAGGFAGATCDVSMYPVDTVKTRLQSRDGFLKSGGFRGIYRGLGSAALGSVPNAASFFLAYDFSKTVLPQMISSDHYVHMVAGCIGETFSCVIRMPFEVVKQTAQACGNFTSKTAMLHIIKSEGVRGLYSGFFSTVCRDVPYTMIQMPIWEYLKMKVGKYNKKDVTAFESGVCGSIAGGIAAALTTPLDVAKTRIILMETTASDYSENPFPVMMQVARKEGVMKLFAGVTPRVIWISAGGFIYFGAYDLARLLMYQYYW